MADIIPNDLMKMMEMTTMNISNMSKQMGVLSAQVTENTTEIANIKAWMQMRESKETVDRDDARRLRSAIHARVCKLLEINYHDGVITPDSIFADKYYRPGFISKCYADARKFSRLGTPYYCTLSRDVEETILYIGKWVPEISFDGLTGVEAYKRYLDARRVA